MKLAIFLAAAVFLPMSAASGQTTEQLKAAAAAPHSMRTYKLTYATSQAEQNEILTAIRNVVSANLRIFLLPSSNELAAYGTADDLSMVADMLAKLDQPHHQYRLTYTLTESEGGKRIGLQHYSMLVTPGQRMQMKEGNRVPVMTGSFSPADKGTGTEKQTTYLDVGLNFDSTLQEHGTGFQLRSRVEQTSIAGEKTSMLAEDPVIRQTLLEGTSILAPGKPLSLGSLDVLGTARQLDVQVTVDAVK